MEPQTNSQLRLPNPILAVFIIAQVVLLIFTVFSISQLMQPNTVSQNDYERQPKVSINNLQSLIPELSTYDISDIERNIFAVINHGQPETDTDLSATVRADTLKEVNFEDETIKYFSAILDVPGVSATYQLYYGYSHLETKAPNNFISILCPLDDDNCDDPANQPSRPEIAYRYLRYFNFDYFTPTINPGEHDKVYINPIQGDVNAEEQESYIKETQQAIESLGISPQLFEYYVLQPGDYTYHIGR